ncbi:hypothetical protein FHL15_000723 [Xylaria flabelliformis]|uniref:Uncharacterized protein n=1 Tax=Xylaria flabelliformis TaxID=2512241 RepID=A0A553IEM4_9PEZI|nr:hypothetical protein FHL15_000723 [Xylaria flabelliformis]
MFGGFAPPQLSEAEIRQLEGEANFTVKQFLATAAVLYICEPGSIKTIDTHARTHARKAYPPVVGCGHLTESEDTRL